MIRNNDEKRRMCSTETCYEAPSRIFFSFWIHTWEYSSFSQENCSAAKKTVQVKWMIWIEMSITLIRPYSVRIECNHNLRKLHVRGKRLNASCSNLFQHLSFGGGAWRLIFWIWGSGTYILYYSEESWQTQNHAIGYFIREICSIFCLENCGLSSLQWTEVFYWC